MEVTVLMPLTLSRFRVPLVSLVAMDPEDLRVW